MFGKNEHVPIVIGGMGVDISTAALALQACSLGGIGHISDAMVPWVSDRNYDSRYSARKAEVNKSSILGFDKSNVEFDLHDVRAAQLSHVEETMRKKKGDGLIFVNVMEKLTMGAPGPTLGTRLNAALDGGIDGVTLSAGLHMQSMKLMEGNPRFHDVKIGIVVSSARALKIFLRSAQRSSRLPDYVVVEGPLAGGHLGFGIDDWHKYSLEQIVPDVLNFLKENDLSIPVIPAGGIFTGSDAVSYLEMGAAAVQVATRFAIAKECGYPDDAKQALIKSSAEDVVVTAASPTGYPLRMLRNSPCLTSKIRPQCESLGYVLDGERHCQYLDYFDAREKGASVGPQKICLCHHFGRYTCWTCGHYAFRLKETTNLKPDGTYQLPSASDVFLDYQFSGEGEIRKPEPEREQAGKERISI